MTKEQRVNGLIQNQATKYAEKDREWLAALSDAQLEAMEPVQADPPAPQPMTNEQVLARAKELGLVEKPATPAPEINAEDRAALDFGKRAMAERRAQLVKHITANAPEDSYSKEELEAMDLSALEKVGKLVKAPEPSYAARPAANAQATDPKAPKVEAMKTPVINWTAEGAPIQ